MTTEHSNTGRGSAEPNEPLESRVARLEAEVASLWSLLPSQVEDAPVRGRGAPPTRPARVARAPEPATPNDSAMFTPPLVEEGGADARRAEALASLLARSESPAAAESGTHESTTQTSAANLRPAKSSSRSLSEMFVGERLLAIAGGLLIVLAMAYFLQLAYQKGWIRGIPPQLRCIVIASLGAALCWLSTLARARQLLWPAAGLGSAGLAGLYGAIYAASAWFAIIPIEVGLMLALGWFVGASFFAWTQRSGVMATVAVIGSVLSPILLTANKEPTGAFPGHMAVLAITALLLASLDFSRYKVAAALALGANFTLGFVWAAFQWATDPVTVMVYAGAVWVATHLAVVRLASIGELSGRVRVAGVASFALGSTAWCLAIWMFALSATGTGSAWMAPAVLAAACAVWSASSAEVLTTLRRVPRTSGERFATLMLVQSASVLVVMVAELTSGPSAYLAWASLGIAAFVSARLLRAPGLVVYGSLLGALAAVRWVMILNDLSVVQTKWFDGSMLVVASFSAKAAVVGCVWLVGAWSVTRCGRRPRGVGTREIAALLSLFGWFWIGLGLLLAQRAVPAGVNAMMLVALLATALGTLHLAWRVHACALLVLCGAMLIGLMDMWDAWASFAPERVLHPGVIHLVALSLGAFWIVRLDRALPERHRSVFVAGGSPALLGFVALMILAVSSHEVARLVGSLTEDPTTRGAAVSMWWAIVGVGLVVQGFRRRFRAARRAGLGLLMAAGAKVVVWDLVNVDTAWRVVALAVVGVLMLAVAIAYARIGKLAARDEEVAEDPREIS